MGTDFSSKKRMGICTTREHGANAMMPHYSIVNGVLAQANGGVYKEFYF